MLDNVGVPAYTSYSKTSRLLEHMDTNRWAQSDTRHLGNKHLVGAALALFLDPPLGLGCLMTH